MDKRVLLACPVCNREWILPYYLQQVKNIDYDKKLIDIYWIVNNSNDKSYDILREFKKKYELEYNNIKIEVYNSKNKFKDERINEVRERHTYDWLSLLRNKILKECSSGDYDYLFSCDSDILVSKNVLNKLISNNKDVISGLIYNGYLFTPQKASVGYDPIINAYKYPNILKRDDNGGYSHIVNYRVKNPNLNKDGTLIDVDFTGAIFLASKDVCGKVSYSWHIQGEDEPFSRSVKEYGYELCCDLSCYSQHVMNGDILELYRMRELKFSNGEIIKDFILS